MRAILAWLEQEIMLPVSSLSVQGEKNFTKKIIFLKKIKTGENYFEEGSFFSI